MLWLPRYRNKITARNIVLKIRQESAIHRYIEFSDFINTCISVNDDIGKMH
jgi:hypothetical protein